MPALEKKQVVSFLKILQIPVDKSPDEIKDLLLEAGWNDKDAAEAVTVLYPHGKEEAEEKERSRASQIVAQKYVQPEERLDEVVAPEPIAEAVSTDAPETIPEPPTIEPAEETISSAVSAVTESVDTVPEEEMIEVQPEPTPTPSPVTVEPPAELISTIAAQQSRPMDEPGRPHTDAPWLRDQVDIYDVTPEEREEMIRTVYRTNERLSPQTIHALLGIDVDLSEFEARYHRQQTGINWVQVIIIFVCSLLIAVAALFGGMYYFEVGPFHPSMDSSLGGIR